MGYISIINSQLQSQILIETDDVCGQYVVVGHKNMYRIVHGRNKSIDENTEVNCEINNIISVNDTTSPGLRDGEKFPTRTITP